MPAADLAEEEVRPLAARTDDGVDLAGALLPAALPRPLPEGARPLTSVVAHGFTGNVRRPAFLRLRLDEPWPTPPSSPLQVVHRIAPTPLLLVHGDRGEYFPVEHVRTLAQAAGPTATASVVPGFGHAETGATTPLLERIGRWASATING